MSISSVPSCVSPGLDLGQAVPKSSQLSMIQCVHVYRWHNITIILKENYNIML